MTKYTAPPDQFDLVLNNGDTLTINTYGFAWNTTVNAGGTEIVNTLGYAEDTTINAGGVEIVNGDGDARNVTFGSTGGTLVLGFPAHVLGTINNWRVGDVIDLLNVTTVYYVHATNSFLILQYAINGDSYERNVGFRLSGKQPDTKADVHQDGHGGADIVLTPTVGIPHQDDHGHHFFA